MGPLVVVAAVGHQSTPEPYSAPEVLPLLQAPERGAPARRPPARSGRRSERSAPPRPESPRKSAPSKTAARTPRRASSRRNGTGSAISSANPPAPTRERRPSAVQVAATAATVPAATAGRSSAP